MAIETIIFQPEAHSPTIKTMTSSGSLEDWKREVCQRVAGHPYLVTFLAAAFAGPLLKPAREDSFGIHLYGLSSRGKTTALQVAASVWGNGSDPAEAPDSAYTRTWNSTANAFEALCAAHNDCAMLLDEIGKCNVKDVGQVTYNLFGGQGKSAMNSDRGLKQQRVWRIVGLSTGEISVVSKIEQNGEKAKGGQQVRFLDTPIVENIVPDAKTAESIKKACGDYYGTAGVCFIQELIDESQEGLILRGMLEAIQEKSIASMPACSSPEKQRGLKHFALVKTAGMLAVDLLELPISKDEISKSIDLVASAWLNAANTLPDSERAFIALRDFILRHRESRFKIIPEDSRLQIPNLAGYWRRGGLEDAESPKHMYYLTEAAMSEALEGFDVKETVRRLKDFKFLHTNDPRRLQVKIPLGPEIKGTLPRGFAIREALLGYSADETPVDPTDE